VPRTSTSIARHELAPNHRSLACDSWGGPPSKARRLVFESTEEAEVVLSTRSFRGRHVVPRGLEIQARAALASAIDVGACAPLVPTYDPAEFVASPIGRCIVRPTFAIWCATPELQGSVLWGALDARSIADMMRAGEFIHHRDISRSRRVLTDLREIERADADVLLGFAAAARDQVASWAAGLERQALLVPAGLSGMMMSGALPMAGVGHHLHIAHDLASALAFVDHPQAAIAHSTAVAIAAATRGPSALIARLRTQLSSDLNGATIESCASALGLSTRTLQRELHRLDTSFSEELRRVRITTAEAMLVHTDLKIDTIALHVGFGNASRMSALLRRTMNLTAGELRAERRNAQ
jgi:AraC-like DNA-binding protein